ncbi:MAG: serine--tRNA ligase [Clostridia bacterium]|nr:serine--tRNA ligase [Clostridia bacterium]
MLDLKYVMANKQEVITAVKNRGGELNLNHLSDLDEKRRSLIAESESKKAEKNKVSDSIPEMMKEGKDVSLIKSKMRMIADEIKELDDVLRDTEAEIRDIMLNIPNVPLEDVPIGKDDTENVEVRKVGNLPSFDFIPKAHWDLGKDLGILDPENAAKISGARFTIYKGLGARLERSLINFFMDTHADCGYKEVLPPYIVSRKTMTGTGQLPKFEFDAFKLSDNESFLIPTAEVPVTNMLAEEVLSESDLPQRYCAYSACFRAEAGSAGRDTRGLIRQHQFNKVELVHFTTPENYQQELERLTAQAESLLQKLELPYRVINLCTGDLGFSSCKTYDIEVYMPSYERYVEISSCSCFGDYQARRMNLRYKPGANEKARFLYTFNGSGLAVGRAVAAVMENYQQKDGSIRVPEVLKPYMRVDVIK